MAAAWTHAAASGREGPAPDDSDAKSLTAAMVALRPELAAAKRTLPDKEQLHVAGRRRAHCSRVGRAERARQRQIRI